MTNEEIKQALGAAPTGHEHHDHKNRAFVFHSPLKVKTGNRKKSLIVSVLCLVALVLIAVVGALLMTQASATDLSVKNQAPSLSHLFGTDQLGRDMFLRTVSGLSTSIGIGLIAAAVSSVIALVLGSAAALGGKKIDTFVTWLIDLMMSVPHIVLLILISFALGKGFIGVTVGVAITHWPSLCRVVRAEVLQVKQSRYVAVARQMGQSSVQIALRHILPAVFPQLLVGLILLFPHAILHEAAITFLGFGLPPEMPAIGVILSEAMSHLSMGAWWLAFFPGLALVGVVMLFDVAGQCIRSLVDPHQAQR
ncbi:MAG: ABC transporter permease [Eggerthellales bacterium]|nr:ABC transporter permease [Eggerthellales bacterium]